jgi:hypothetical protein
MGPISHPSDGTHLLYQRTDPTGIWCLFDPTMASCPGFPIACLVVQFQGKSVPIYGNVAKPLAFLRFSLNVISRQRKSKFRYAGREKGGACR